MHGQHRERMRKRFETEDLDAFEEHQVLEMMLFYAIPRKDTNVIAHRLIEQFGGFSRVMDAPLEELEKVEGMGYQSALLLKFIRSSYKYYWTKETSPQRELRTIEECAKYLMARLDARRNEEVCLLCLDARRRVINCRKVEEGEQCHVRLSIRKVINIALAENAVSVILAHNHPVGFAVPSAEDQEATYKLAEALKSIDVCLLDHMVVTNREYISMLKSGLYSPEAVGFYIDR